MKTAVGHEIRDIRCCMERRSSYAASKRPVMAGRQWNESCYWTGASAARAIFQGSSSAMRLIGWSAICSNTCRR